MLENRERYLGVRDSFPELSEEDWVVLVTNIEAQLIDGPQGCRDSLAKIFSVKEWKRTGKRFEIITEIAGLPNSRLTQQTLGRVISVVVASGSRQVARDRVYHLFERFDITDEKVHRLTDLGIEIMMGYKNELLGQTSSFSFRN